MRRLATLLLVLPLATAVLAQESDPPKPLSDQPPAISERDGKILVPSGTQIPLVLKQAISTKNAKPGDAVYAETAFPITLNDHVVIPAGTYVQGRISEVKRGGRVKGRAQLLMHFTTLVYPNGYTTMLPGSVENVPGADKQTVSGEEGTIKQDGEKMKDVSTVAQSAGTGAMIGGLATQSGKGIAVGGLAGAAAGLGYALLTRGPDVMLPVGTSVQMVLQRPLTLDEAKVNRH